MVAAGSAYLAAIRWVDHAVERVRRKLDSAGYLDDTVMIFSADHGEAFGEHGVHGHARNVLTPTLWVPLVIRLPSPIEPVRVRSQVRNLDVAPTLLELAGLGIPPDFEGVSLLPILTGGGSDPDRISFASLGVPLFRDASVQAAVTTGAWTYARNELPPTHAEAASARRGVDPGKELLFDRSVDPGENVNLVDRELEAAARMRQTLDRYLAGQVQADALQTGVRIDPSIADRLRAMGYLE